MTSGLNNDARLFSRGALHSAAVGAVAGSTAGWIRVPVTAILVATPPREVRQSGEPPGGRRRATNRGSERGLGETRRQGSVCRREARRLSSLLHRVQPAKVFRVGTAPAVRYECAVSSRSRAACVGAGATARTRPPSEPPSVPVPAVVPRAVSFAGGTVDVVNPLAPLPVGGRQQRALPRPHCPAR